MKLITTALVVMCVGLALPANAAPPKEPEPKSTTAYPKCGKGKTWDEKAAKCTHGCGNGYRWNAKAGTCKCERGAVCNCKDGLVWNGTACACPPDSTINIKAIEGEKGPGIPSGPCIKVSCPPGWMPDAAHPGSTVCVPARVPG